MLKNKATVERRRAALRKMGLPEHKLKDEQLVLTATVRATVRTLLEAGFPFEKIPKMAKLVPALMYIAPNTAEDAVENFLKKGFSPDQSVDVCIAHPQFLLETKRANALIRNLRRRGFSAEEVVRVAHGEPDAIYNSAKVTNRRLDVFAEYGFNRAQIVTVVHACPWIVRVPEDQIRATLGWLLRRHGREKMIEMVVKSPILMRSSPERLGEHDVIFAHLGVDASKRPSLLMFAPSIYRGRIMHLSSLPDANWKCLFRSNGYYQKKYGLARKDVIALDPGAEAFRNLPKPATPSV